MLEAVFAVSLGSIVLAGAGEQARMACAMLGEARRIAAATTAARNVLDAALAAPCATQSSASEIWSARASSCGSWRQPGR